MGQPSTRTIESESPREGYMGFKLFWRIGSVTVLTITALVFAGHWAGPTLAQIKPPESEILPFIGTWTAVHSGTPIIVLHLRPEKGQLVGGIQVCSYSVNTETSGTVDVVTDSTLSKILPINNIKVSGRSMSFDWKGNRRHGNPARRLGASSQTCANQETELAGRPHCRIQADSREGLDNRKLVRS